MSLLGAYRRLVRLYPPGFRRSYGPDLVLLAEELVLDLGPRRAAARLASDLLTSLPARHLEVLVKRPSPVLLPSLGAVAAATLLVLAAVVGTAVGVGVLVLALLSASVAVLAFPHARIVRERTVSSHWWQLILLGLALHLALIVGQQITGSASAGVWMLAAAAVIGGWLAIGTGVVLAVVHALSRHRRPAL